MRCYYCDSQLPSMPWYHRDEYLGKVVRICDRCQRRFEEERDRRIRENGGIE